MATILLSIKPEYAKLIFEGIKKYEFRKFLPKYNVTRIIVYSTSPEKLVLGEVEVKKTISMKKTPLWELTKKDAGISRLKYRDYFRDSKQAHAFVLGKANLYNKPKMLKDFDIQQAPQSYVYLKECPYCKNIIIKNDTATSKSNSHSVEHIVPFSLGNEDLILKEGIICDDCNNYFARNIEKPFLELEEIKLLRTYHSIPSRKSKIPPMNVFINNEKACMKFDARNNCAYIGLSPETILKIYEKKVDMFFSSGIDTKQLQNSYVVSRFLVKVFTETCLFYGIKFQLKETNNSFFILDKKMEELHEYVRFAGREKRVYDYSVTKIKEIVPLSQDDFVSSIKLNVNENKKCLTGMVFRLFELEFVLNI